MSISPIPPPSSKEIPSPKGESIKRHSHKKKKYYGENAWETLRLVRATWVLGFFTFVVAGFAVIQAIITRNALNDQATLNGQQIQAILIQDTQIRRQADAAETQITLSRAAAKSQDSLFGAQDSAAWSQIALSRSIAHHQLRAYVYLQLDSVLGKPHGTYASAYSLKNSGLTPAYHVKFYYTNGAKHFSDTAHFDDPKDTNTSPAVPINPGQTHTGFESDFTTNTRWQNLIDSNKAAAFVWGKIWYYDIFGAHHTTRFRLQSTEDGRGMEWSEKGNDEN